MGLPWKFDCDFLSLQSSASVISEARHERSVEIMRENVRRPALIIGNGPSVDRIAPQALKAFETFGTNHIYKKFDAWGHSTDHVVITDSNRLAEISDNYRVFPGTLHVGHQCRHAVRYARTRRLLGRDFVPIRQLLKAKLERLPLKNHWYVPPCLHPVVFDKSRFSFSQEKGLNFGYSVVIGAIQLAVSLGHRRIYLAGVDASYPHPRSYFESAKNEVQYVNQTFVSNPRLWMEPWLVGLQIEFETRGVELFDATPNGKLRFIPKTTLEDVLTEHA